MKVSNFWLLFILLFLITSCKEKVIVYKFEGVVTNSLNNEGEGNVEITVSQKKVQNGSATNFLKAKTLSTNADGSYSFVIEREKVSAFLFEFEKENFFDHNIERTTATITTDGTNEINGIIEPKAYVDFKIKNLYPEDYDHLKFTTYNLREGCTGCAVNQTFDFYAETDTTLSYTTTAGKYVKFTYINVFTGFSKTDSVYTAPFETTTYLIEY